MTGYTVHTGSSLKFSSSWDRIFQDAKSNTNRSAAGPAAAKKSPASRGQKSDGSSASKAKAVQAISKKKSVKKLATKSVKKSVAKSAKTKAMKKTVKIVKRGKSAR